jgi:Raf kinase inhibitor-like YbhB/YbcL family protein
MELKSSAFEAGGMIPKPYTCDGQDASPPLSWSDVPTGTKSLALIADDPDAPMGTWVHWVAWNIPATARGLEAQVPKRDSLPNGMKQGTTDFRRVGYGGPVPRLALTDISSNCMRSTQPSRCRRARRRRIWRT